LKSISASIIIVGGLATVIAAAHYGHSDNGTFMTTVSIVAALAGWIKTLREP
jgi:hypothetical protein